MNSNEAAQLATLLIDTYAAAETAKKCTTRSTIAARDYGHVEGTLTGVVRYAELACKAHGARITNLVRSAHTGQTNWLRATPLRAAAIIEEITADLAVELIELAERATCGDRILWRDEDVAMARQDLAPFRCLRTPGHDSRCEMHPGVVAILAAGGTPTVEDYQAPVPA